MKLTALLIMLSTFLFGCGTSDNVVLLCEEFWWEFVLGKGENLDRLHAKSASLGLGYTLHVTDETETSKLSSLLDFQKTRVVILGPFKAQSALLLAEDHPNIGFIQVDGFFSEKLQPSNLLTILFNRDDVHFEAGRELGMHMLDSLSFGSRAGVLVSYRSPAVREEFEAFQMGYDEVKGVPPLIVKELRQINDRVQAKRLIETMRREQVEIFFLKTFTATPYCLDLVEKEGAKAIVEDWNGQGAYDDVLLFSIESDYVTSIENGLDLLSTSEEGWKQKNIRGVSRIHWISRGEEVHE